MLSILFPQIFFVPECFELNFLTTKLFLKLIFQLFRLNEQIFQIFNCCHKPTTLLTQSYFNSRKFPFVFLNSFLPFPFKGWIIFLFFLFFFLFDLLHYYGHIKFIVVFISLLIIFVLLISFFFFLVFFLFFLFFCLFLLFLLFFSLFLLGFFSFLLFLFEQFFLFLLLQFCLPCQVRNFPIRLQLILKCL